MSKESYKFYKSHHICVRCGQKDAEEKHVLCLECKMENRKVSHISYYKNRESLQKRKRETSRQRYYELKEKEMCVKCGKRKARNGKILCAWCAEKQNRHKRDKYKLIAYATKNINCIRV